MDIIRKGKKWFVSRSLWLKIIFAVIILVVGVGVYSFFGAKK